MLTGFNTDVKHEDRIFHVQTEDKGQDNPIIETLIYVGGQILASRRRSYAEKADGLSKAALSEIIERQHKAVVRDIRLGKFDPPEMRQPFGEGIITNRTLDEVVKDFIVTAAAEGNLPEVSDRPVAGQKRSAKQDRRQGDRRKKERRKS